MNPPIKILTNSGLLSFVFFIFSCASSRHVDIGAKAEPIVPIEIASPIVLMSDSTKLFFDRIRVTPDLVYGQWDGVNTDTIISTGSIKEIRFKNLSKGMFAGFLIGLSPGVITYSTAGFGKKENEDQRRTQGIWLGIIGALVAVGFSHDAAPTDTIVFGKAPVKQNTDDADQTD